MKIVNKNCCGCSSCVNICPVNAIKFDIIDGFYQAIINEDVCINCGLCNKVCSSEPIFFDVNKQKIACFSAKDDNILNCSQSGGAFAVISSALIEENYKIYGAVFNKETFRVEHQCATTLRELHDMFGSKYVQSYLGSTFTKIKNNLINNEKVLFSGTPCQVGGLIKYLSFSKINISNLLTIEVICSNVSSPIAWTHYLKKYKKYGLLYINFRDKKNGWRSFSQTYITKKKGAITNNEYSKIYSRLILSNETCFACKHKQVRRCADITIGDFWGIEKNNGTIRYNNPNGNSIILFNSDKSIKIMEILKQHNFEFVSKKSNFWLQLALFKNWNRPNNIFYKLRKVINLKYIPCLFLLKLKLNSRLKRIIYLGTRVPIKILRLLGLKK